VGERSRLPNLIIAGTVKSGTPSLYQYLLRHSEICGSSVKETCFFLPVRYGSTYGTIETYEQYFRHCTDQKIVMESTPGYFEGGRDLAGEIKRQLGSVRVILLLRDPVDRLVSFFKYKKAQVELPEDLELEQYLSDCLSMDYGERRKPENDRYWGVDGGRYIQHLPGWFEVFGKDNVRIIFFEHFIVDAVDVIADILSWLELDDERALYARLSAENRTVHYRNRALQKLAIAANRMMEPFSRRAPAFKRVVRDIYYFINSTRREIVLDDEARRRLQALYEDDNRKLAEFVSEQGYTDIPDWLTENSS